MASSEGGGSTTSTTTGAQDEGSEDGLDSAAGFIPPDDVESSYECSIFTQDCPEAHKCMPWANDGSNVWNDWGCFPVAEDPDVTGEACTVVGSGVSGMDSCDAGAMCWDVEPGTLEGVCFALCSGGPLSPVCEDPETTCAVPADGLLALCLPSCDPLSADCPRSEGCYPIGDGFFCNPDQSGGAGQPGTPCEQINGCETGAGCINPDDVPSCDGPVGCCSSFCDLGDPMPPCLLGQVCTAWYDEELTPPGYEHLGICLG